MTTAELRKRYAQWPRIRLAHLPTPLEELKNLSRHFGGPRLFIKRDDLTGLAFGGNKTRMFEFLLAKIKEDGYDAVVGGAAIQSNYARQLTAACNIAGLEPYLVLRKIPGYQDKTVQGNLLLDLLGGARVSVVDDDQELQRAAMYRLAEKLNGQGIKAAVVRMAAGGDLTPDCTAYVDCFCEIADQCHEQGIKPDYLYAASYDSTQAGLEVGRAALGMDVAIRGIAPAAWGGGAAETIVHYAHQTAGALGIELSLTSDTIYNTTDFVGEKYGVPTNESVEMVKLMARKEGIYLDPIYTGKALAAIREHIRQGQLTANDTVLFLHTGGNPALFAYKEFLDPSELETHFIDA
jgi:1-aminocyclopropane-1-carboxylate deaminase/D-cysteine desulfhydrase-like pyridoxal-dependent ACC family enzyme